MRILKRKLRIWERVLIRAAEVALVIVIVYGAWNYWANLPPRVNIPPQKLPNPNALDCFVRSTELIADKDKIVWALTKPSAPVVPAPPRDAGAQSTPSPAVAPPPANRPPAATPLDRERVLKANAAALAKLREGLNCSCAVPRLCDGLSLTLSLSRAMLLLYLETAVLAERNDWSGAANSSIDAIQVLSMVSGEFGYPEDIQAGRWIWRAIPHLSIPQTRAALRRMEKITSSQVSFAAYQRNYKIRVQAQLLQNMDTPGWRERYAREVDLLDSKDHRAEKLYYRMASKSRIMADWTSALDEAIQCAQKPFSQTPKDHYYLTDKCELFYYYPFVHERLVWESRCASNMLATTALALRAYKLEREAYPKTLSDLVPGYLARLPDDPFANSGPFHYSPSGDDYVLYSVGPNCSDDGGKPTAEDVWQGDIVVTADGLKAERTDGLW